MRWIKTILIRLTLMGNLLPGTKLDPTKVTILSAYILSKNGKDNYIVIVTAAGSEIYPYTQELENALKGIGFNLVSHELDIHEVVKFYFENEPVINMLDALVNRKSKFEP
jgi:hypothetical protein